MPLAGEIFIPSRSGGEGVAAVFMCLCLCADVFMSKFVSVGTIGRDVRHRFQGGSLCALPDAGWHRGFAPKVRSRNTCDGDRLIG